MTKKTQLKCYQCRHGVIAAPKWYAISWKSFILSVLTLHLPDMTFSTVGCLDSWYWSSTLTNLSMYRIIFFSWWGMLSVSTTNFKCPVSTMASVEKDGEKKPSKCGTFLPWKSQINNKINKTKRLNKFYRALAISGVDSTDILIFLYPNRHPDKAKSEETPVSAADCGTWLHSGGDTVPLITSKNLASLLTPTKGMFKSS